MVLADGIGVKLAGRILNTNIRQNVNGTDFFPNPAPHSRGSSKGGKSGFIFLGENRELLKT